MACLVEGIRPIVRAKTTDWSKDFATLVEGQITKKKLYQNPSRHPSILRSRSHIGTHLFVTRDARHLATKNAQLTRCSLLTLYTQFHFESVITTTSRSSMPRTKANWRPSRDHEKL